MKRILGIKFSHYGQIYFFYCEDPLVNIGDHVLAETGQGLGLAMVMTIVERLPEDLIEEPVRDILRKVTSEDLEASSENEQLLYNAHRFCESRIRERQLDMKLVDVEVLFDRSKLVFYFTAPTRIDFRELVKDLVREYHTRIELRQIGVRHETQMLGAVGSCGMVCCCRRFLHKFVPVTIKMAKEQNLFLNPSKISGICGRLLCCLSYEQENYDLFHSSCPRLGKRYQTSRGPMKVLRANMFRNSVAVLTDANEELELTLEEWEELAPCRPDVPPRLDGRPDAPAATPHSEGLLVVQADPDSFDDDIAAGPDSLDALDEAEADDVEGADNPDTSEEARSRRKRKRKR
ncbi:MAG: regulatory iron-sulfur-containing complex subunit RicT [Bilophila sp.]